MHPPAEPARPPISVEIPGFSVTHLLDALAGMTQACRKFPDSLEEAPLVKVPHCGGFRTTPVPAVKRAAVPHARAARCRPATDR